MQGFFRAASSSVTGVSSSVWQTCARSSMHSHVKHPRLMKEEKNAHVVVEVEISHSPLSPAHYREANGIQLATSNYPSGQKVLIWKRKGKKRHRCEAHAISSSAVISSVCPPLQPFHCPSYLQQQHPCEEWLQKRKKNVGKQYANTNNSGRKTNRFSQKLCIF